MLAHRRQTDSALLERCLRFELELDRRAAERIEETDWGAVFLSPSIPLVWDANWILVERPGLAAAEIAALADEAIGGAGMKHRTAFAAGLGEGARLAGEFAALGWQVERTVYMVWGGEPSWPEERSRTAAVEAEERPHSRIEPLRRELIRGGLPIMGVTTDETVEQLIEWDRRLGEAGGDRWFVAPALKPASCCRLLVGGGVGQVEDVGTLAAARERGFARTVTLAAARASRADGNELTYLGALADDWPRLMYERLGFEPAGTVHAFRRRPDTAP